MASAKRDRILDIETVFFHLYDAGRSIDIPGALRLLGAGRGRKARMGRDTPDYMALPQPLVLELPMASREKAPEGASALAKLYPDGAISIVLRSRHRSTAAKMHLLREQPFAGSGETAQAFAERSFRELFCRVEALVDHQNYPAEPSHKSYAAWCIRTDVGDPAAFVTARYRELGALLIDGSDDPSIHESQLANTLSHPFSFREGELAVFDFDRCIIIDPLGDYEDILLVAEHANYQLLELRQLDLLLDGRLEVAETDMRTVFIKPRTFPSLAGFKSFRRKFAEIQALRLDALFLLENLENSSKIIGDYHLGKIYGHLCEIFNTSSWRWSVERRLETLQSLYELARGDVNDRTMMTLEVVFILVCVFQVFQMFFL